ncbi:MAG: hypothetical protein GTN80_02425 [Nitrososphaeria archaeon]|nr:hypothetical protein [Nitrososphaeria archaeon]NIQ32493.1 hypothetical protein [Nitrososphaeria archaeon]
MEAYRGVTKPGMDILKEACDLHLHTGPSIFQRLIDDVEAAEQARSAGMKAIVLKDHHQQTASRATIARKFVPEVETFGGVVLNYAVGGLNPFAVVAAINYGGKIIYMPTTDAANHIEFFGSEGATYARLFKTVSGRQMSYRGKRGITILTERDELVPETEEILNLIAEADIILGTCHLSPKEIEILVEEARNASVKKILVTHATWPPINLSVEKQVELARKGAYIEQALGVHLPWTYERANINITVKAIREVGADRSILSSDLGQVNNPFPVEGLRSFYVLLERIGIKKEDLRTMACANPAKLLGVQ